MEEPSKRVRKLVREYQQRAYDEELRRALSALAEDFGRWSRGEIDGHELSERIHRFHDGEARDLYNTYARRIDHVVVAGAVHRGILDRASIPGELLGHLAPSLAFFAEYEAEPADSVDEEPGIQDGGMTSRPRA